MLSTAFSSCGDCAVFAGSGPVTLDADLVPEAPLADSVGEALVVDVAEETSLGELTLDVASAEFAVSPSIAGLDVYLVEGAAKLAITGLPPDAPKTGLAPKV